MPKATPSRGAPHAGSPSRRFLSSSTAASAGAAPAPPTTPQPLPTAALQALLAELALPATLCLSDEAAAHVQRLAEAARAVVAQDDFGRGLADFGMTPRYRGPRELAAQLRTETEMWRGHIKKIGFTSES